MTIDEIRMILVLLIAIVITHAVVFMIASYCVTGDPFLALRNFYFMRYNMGV